MALHKMNKKKVGSRIKSREDQNDPFKIMAIAWLGYNCRRDASLFL